MRNLSPDDEVAVIHVSEAMVDIRATLAAAESAKVLSPRTASALTRIGKEIFFKERNWETLTGLAADMGLPKAQLARLVRWLPANRVERKRRDALGMVEAMRQHLQSRPRPFRARFKFRRTVFWQNLVERGA